ncbi:DNA polymerase II large subunit [Halorutilales archaeon Cl-col2-1]
MSDEMDRPSQSQSQNQRRDDYLQELEDRLWNAMEIANEARSRGGDPSPEVEIPVAKDLAERVENLIGIEGISERIRELEDEMSRENVALKLAEEFAVGEIGDSDSKAGKAEDAIRTAVALLTEGVVAAPLEGIDAVEVRQNDDGTEYLSVEYAGPIRSAGGTAQALSVLVADYVRTEVGIDEYKPRDDEVERYVEEIDLYASETGLQYTPKDKEVRKIVENCPIFLDGEPTSEREVSGYRDLERIETNRARGGMCLVAAEGIALKAPKIKKHVTSLGLDGWGWLDFFIHDSSDDDAESEEGEDETEEDGDDTDGSQRPRVDPNDKFLQDLIAGRPVFSHPSAKGGFRLRYARARNTGYAASGISPATMVLVDNFLAPGTQLKTERPGKAAGVAPVDSLEGPTVRLHNGEVRRIDDADEAKRIRNGVEKIIDMGEIGVNYGDFLENNHPLAPASYVYDWWIQDLGETEADVEELSEAFDLEEIAPRQALRLSDKYGVPLHPNFTYLWHDISLDEYSRLLDAVMEKKEGKLLLDGDVSDLLEKLLVPHIQNDDTVRVGDGDSVVLERYLDADSPPDDAETVLDAVEEVSGIETRERAPTRVGARMGRPEKSKRRDMNPRVHCLFPIGEAGGSQRDIDEATSYSETMRESTGRIDVEVGVRRCPDCGETTYETVCDCGERTEPVEKCPRCGVEVDDRDECPRCGGETSSVEETTIDIKSEYREALDELGERDSYDILKCVKGLSSEDKTPEPLEKGVLRAKHDVSAFKDGTSRYDLTDLPLTAFKPAELDVSVEKVRELGYETDIDGEPLRDPEQVVELKPQDVVLSDDAAEYMVSVADYVDDLLEEYYGTEPYYGIDDRDDLVGELVMGLAPHTSAGVLGRVVGFTSASVGYAHPFFHAAKRRNCFHPETKVWVKDEDGWRYERIEELVEGNLEDPRRDDFGNLIQEIEDDRDLYVPSVDSDGETVVKRIDALSKHPSPEHLIEIETRSGRSLSLTPDHELQAYDRSSGEIHTKKAVEMSEDDHLITPRDLPVDSDSTDLRFDLLEEFLRIPEIENDRLMVKGWEKDEIYELFEESLETEWVGEFYPLKSTAEYLGMTKKSLSNYIYRGSLPASILLELLGSAENVVSSTPDDLKLGIKRDSVEIDRFIDVNENVATLLGYYAAEGFVREQETSKGSIHQTTFCGAEEDVRDFYLRTLEEEFGVSPYVENEFKITVSGRLLRVLLDSVLQAGVYSHTKRVPDFVFDAPPSIAAAYLKGYFSGDGHVSSDVLEVHATTVSDELKEDLLAVLTRLGIKAKVREKEPVRLHEKFPDYYDAGTEKTSLPTYRLSISSKDAATFGQKVGFHLPRKQSVLSQHLSQKTTAKRIVFDGSSDEEEILIESVEEVEYTKSDTDFVYCLTVNDTHSLVANDLGAKQCDGDEDCVMLLMDGLLNFSKSYLPDKRGGQMDAPLVMTTRIDPEEIDDESHNVDTVDRYPLDFYEATREIADSKSVDVPIAEDGLNDPDLRFDHTVETSEIAGGPDNSSYKTLGSMLDKTENQLELARKIRAVKEDDVAERIIESHFLPDLIGNLRAFGQQEVRCTNCNSKYRRPPLSGRCECGSELTLTVHEGSVRKYLDVSLRVGEEYGASNYTLQRLEQLERSIDSIFEDDKSRQSGIADFM